MMYWVSEISGFKLITLLVLVILTAGMAGAVKPGSQFSDPTIGLSTISPKYLAFPFGDNLTLHFHVFNSTNHPYTGANCSFHLYGNDGSHISQLYAEVDGQEYEVMLDTNNLSYIGHYPYLFFCGNETEAGYISDSFEITSTGTTATDDKSPLIAVILIPLIFAGIFLFGMLRLNDQHTGLKWLAILITPLTAMGSLWVSLEAVTYLYSWVDMQHTLSQITWMFSIMAVIIFTYLMLYFMLNIWPMIRGKGGLQA